jgi:HSP20 family protein
MLELEMWMPCPLPREDRRNPEVSVRSAGIERSLAMLHGEMERMFDRFWTNPMADLEPQEPWFGDSSQAMFEPKLDVTDDENFLRVTLEIPGVEVKDIVVQVQDGVMTISGEKQRDAVYEEACYQTERSYGSFRRAIPLPAEVETGKAEAKFDKGVLTVKLPITAKAKELATKIPIDS